MVKCLPIMRSSSAWIQLTSKMKIVTILLSVLEIHCWFSSIRHGHFFSLFRYFWTSKDQQFLLLAFHDTVHADVPVLFCLLGRYLLLKTQITLSLSILTQLSCIIDLSIFLSHELLCFNRWIKLRKVCNKISISCLFINIVSKYVPKWLTSAKYF